MIHVRCARLAELEVKEHWDSTILQKRTLDEIKPYLSQDQFRSLRDEGMDAFNFWGDTDATLKRTKKIEYGEQILFYGEKKFHAKAIAGPTFVNEDLADYFWSHRSINNSNKEELPWQNIYVLKDLTDTNIFYKPSDILKKDKSPRESKIFRGAEYLESFQLTPEFIAKLELCWEEGDVSSENTRRGIPRDAIIKKAQIYKVTFSIDGKNIVYVGQDLKCQSDYFGSSLIIYHYKKLYGDNLFNKEIIDELYDQTKGTINDLENFHIKEQKKRIENISNTYSINYTGENQG